MPAREASLPSYSLVKTLLRILDRYGTFRQGKAHGRPSTVRANSRVELSAVFCVFSCREASHGALRAGNVAQERVSLYFIVMTLHVSSHRTRQK